MNHLLRFSLKKKILFSFSIFFKIYKKIQRFLLLFQSFLLSYLKSRIDYLFYPAEMGHMVKILTSRCETSEERYTLAGFHPTTVYATRHQVVAIMWASEQNYREERPIRYFWRDCPAKNRFVWRYGLKDATGTIILAMLRYQCPSVILCLPLPLSLFLLFDPSHPHFFAFSSRFPISAILTLSIPRDIAME